VKENMAIEYFKNLCSHDDDVNPEEVVNLFSQVITDEMNYDLSKPYTVEEISDAIFQIGPIKAPGLDGYPACFFQRNWPFMKEDIVWVVQVFFEIGIMKEGVNDTCIVLIPKVSYPKSLKNFAILAFAMLFTRWYRNA
jgi:hypothetical protein